MKKIAFIPARSGSKRLPNKNVKEIRGHPLIAYAIQTAKKTGLFDRIVCATDSPVYAEIAAQYGAEVPILRPEGISTDTSPDIAWVRFMLSYYQAKGENFDIFSILRPTSPFRSVSTICKVMSMLLEMPKADSVRGVEVCRQHPGKMWVIRSGLLFPILPYMSDSTPWHSSQKSLLPEIYEQNASIEVAWTRVVGDTGTISGNLIIPYITDEYEGFDINTQLDWLVMEDLLRRNLVSLPEIELGRLFLTGR